MTDDGARSTKKANNSPDDRLERKGPRGTKKVPVFADRQAMNAIPRGHSHPRDQVKLL